LENVVTPYSADWEDSGQLLRDQKIAEMFREFTEDMDGIKELDMICNLVMTNIDDRRQPFCPFSATTLRKTLVTARTKMVSCFSL
jgi:hypothetical protein